MNPFALKFLTTYLLMPLLAILFCFLALLMAKKNKVLGNKKLLFFILLISFLLALPALFGFVHYWFMPYIYGGLSIIYLIVGTYNIRWVKHFWPDIKKKSYFAEIFIQSLIMFVGAAIFSLIFNLCNELQYGFWASTCLTAFILPSLFLQTFKKYKEIPLEIFKVWRYSDHLDLSSFEHMDYDKLLVMEVELNKKIDDIISSKIKAKAPDNMPFGVWFQKFLTDYNLKFPMNPIEIRESDTNPTEGSHTVYGWIFYVKRSFFHPRKYIDYDLTINENKIKEHYTIMAKRVNEQSGEEISGTDN